MDGGDVARAREGEVRRGSRRSDRPRGTCGPLLRVGGGPGAGQQDQYGRTNPDTSLHVALLRWRHCVTRLHSPSRKRGRETAIGHADAGGIESAGLRGYAPLVFEGGRGGDFARRLWTGRVISVLVSLVFVMSASMKPKAGPEINQGM